MRRPEWLGRRRPATEPAGMVRLAGKAPRTPLERWIAAEFAEEPCLPVARLETRVADRWLQEELRDGAGTADVALWGPALARREVRRALGALEGDFVLTLAPLPPAAHALA